MKRLFFVFTVVLLSIGLAGCDMITPAQVEEISEQFCRDNPTSEICQGDAVGDLEDEVILNVFNTIIDEYNDEENETFCDDYFSVTNPELLDSCRASREELIPTDYTDFTVSNVEKKSTLSTQDVYEITVLSDDLTIEVVFSIGLVNVEGIMYISSWSFELTETTPAEHDVSLEDARAFFEQFIDDYMNPEISSEVVCNQYFDEEIDDCIAGRENSLEVNLSVVLNAMDATEETGLFDVELEFNDDESTEVDVQFNQMRFVYDEEGNIVMTFINDEDPGEHPDNWLNADDAFDIVELFLIDYSNDEMSNDDFNEKYFDNSMEWDFFLNRNDELNKGVIFDLVFVDEPTEEPLDYLVVTMQRTYEGEVKTIIVKLRVNDLGEGRYFFDIIFEDDERLDYDMLWDYLLTFVFDYQDPAVSNIDICQMYFPNDDPDECIARRQEMIDSGVAITLNDLREVRDYYEVEFELDDGVEIAIQTVFINFFYDDAHNLQFEFNDLGFDEIDYYDALSFMQNLVFQYSDPDLTSYEVCIQFFEGDSYEECVIRREQEMMDGITLDGFELFNDGYGYKVDYFYIDADDFATTKHLNAYFYYNEDGELRLELFEDFHLIPYETIQPFIIQMVLDFNSWGMDSDYLCNYYFGPESAPGCVGHRNQMIADGVTVDLSMISPEYDHYRIEFEYTDADGISWFETVNAFFYFDEYDNLKVDFRNDGPEEFPYDEAYDYFQALLTDFSDNDLTDIEFCNLYFPDMGDLCLWDRAIMPLEDMAILLTDFNFDGHMFIADIMFENTDTGDIDYKTVYLEFYWDEYGNVGMHIYEEPMVGFLNYVDASVIIQQFYLDLSNETITFEQLDAWYFDYQMDPEFELGRLDLFVANQVLTVFEINDPSNADGQDFLEVTIDTYQDGLYLSSFTAWIRVIPLSNGYNLLEFRDDGHEEEHNLTYDEAYAFTQQFMADYSNELLPSYDVCSMYFDSYDYPSCIIKRDQEMLDGVYLELNSFDEVEPGEFFMEIEYYDFDGSLLYTDYSHVYFFIAERGELKLSIELFDPNFSFPHDDAMMFIDALLADFMDPSITNDDYCDVYGFIFEDCHLLRSQILDNAGYIYLSNFFNEQDNLFFFEFGYQEIDGDDPIYIGLLLEFNYDEFGNIVVTVHDNHIPEFTYADFLSAQTFWITYLTDYVNPSITTEEIADLYFGGFIDLGYYETRSEDLLRGVSFDVDDIVFEDLNHGDGIDWITVTYVLTTGAVNDTLIENFRVMLYEVPYFQIELESFNPEVVDYGVAADFFDDYVADLLDPGIDNNWFCSIYTEDFIYPQCMDFRDDIVSLFDSAIVSDFHFDDYMFMYQGTIDFFDADGQYVESRSYDLMFWYDFDGLLRVELIDFHDDYDPLFDDLYDMIMDYPLAYLDLTVSSVDFCTEYFNGDPDCVVMRDQLLTISTLYVSVEDFHWDNVCYDGACTDDVIYVAHIVYNLGAGDFISQRVEVVPYYDESDNLQMDLFVTRTETSVPLGSILVDEVDAIGIFITFALDYTNPALSSEDFCMLYFNGNSHCMDDRYELIEMGGIASFIDYTIEFDDDGLPFYVVNFEVTIDGDTMNNLVGLRVWETPSTHIFIEFVDYLDDGPAV